MQRQITRLIEQFESVQSRLHRLTDVLPEDLWSRRPTPDRWSVAECVIHLNLTSEAVMPRLRAAVAKASSFSGLSAVHLRQNLTGRIFAIAIGPVLAIGPIRFGTVRAPASIVPRWDAPPAETMSTFDRFQQEWISLVSESDGRPIDRVITSSPFIPRLKYNAYSGFIIVARHELRHVVQAERSRREL
jgi:hypothetical protein